MVTTQKQTSRKKTVSKASSTTATVSDVFTSGAIKGLVLVLILAFNVVVLKNSFLMAVPEGALSGNVQIDGVLYGLAISVLMVIVLFHEEQWHNAFCPGAITLYVDTLILVLYTKWFEWLIGSWWTLWLMNGLMIIMPVMGLFIMVIMLKK
ncbi:MAG: hypothetical protein HC880_00200 [Bacteroidia bacterium]|nr:hypothetical protein [Bacteroidia bacterium]